jgi:hypothetical protein
MLYKDKKTKEKYKQEIVVDNQTSKFNEITLDITNNLVEKPIEQLKTIRELLRNENENNYIKAYHYEPHSPGLEYVKVYKNALKHSKIKGYIKMDNAAAFWGDVYYAEDKRWISYK